VCRGTRECVRQFLLRWFASGFRGGTTFPTIEIDILVLIAIVVAPTLTLTRAGLRASYNSTVLRIRFVFIVLRWLNAVLNVTEILSKAGPEPDTIVFVREVVLQVVSTPLLLPTLRITLLLLIVALVRLATHTPKPRALQLLKFGLLLFGKLVLRFSTIGGFGAVVKDELANERVVVLIRVRAGSGWRNLVRLCTSQESSYGGIFVIKLLALGLLPLLILLTQVL